MFLPTWLVLGGVVAAATLAGEFARNYAPHLPSISNQTLNNLAHTAVNSVLAAGSTAGAVRIFNLSEFSTKGAVPLALIGGDSYVAAWKKYCQ